MSRIGLPDVVADFEAVPRHEYFFSRLFELLHAYSLGVFALLFLLVASSAVIVGKTYWSAQIPLAATIKSTFVHIPARPLRGPNMVVASTALTESLRQITTQPISLIIGDKAVPVNPDTIKSWLQIVTDARAGVAYIHVNSNAASQSLTEMAAPFVKAPTNQVTATYADGSSRVIVAGRDGLKLGDTSTAAKQIGQNLLSAKGLQLNLPTETQAFAATTPAAFDKLIEVNVVTKQMYLYDKGQLTRSYPISAGAPATPTPIGQYKIYSKLAVQDMRGFNTDGTRYFQPHVRWINYFLPGGYGVHGNYWRPLSAFGTINSSHGCVSLPEDQAKWVYDWAPLGTTVITHY